MAGIGRVAPLDHSRIGATPTAAALQRGSLLQEITPPTFALSAAHWGEKPLSGVVRGASTAHAR